MAADNHTSETLHPEQSTTDDKEMPDNDSQQVIDDDNDDDDDVDDFDSTKREIGEGTDATQIETLTSPTYYLNAEVPKEYITLQRHGMSDLKSKVQGSHQEVLASVIAQAAQAQVKNNLQSPTYTPPSSSAPSPNKQEQRLTPVANSSSLCLAVVNQENASDHISAFSTPIVRKHATDGYNWRKYGQKQVKSPPGSRSYYRCTCTQCYAKKIECCDNSNLIKEVVYKGQHNHDPPTKVNRARDSKVALSATPISVISNTSQSIHELKGTDPSTSLKAVNQGMPSVPELKIQNSSDSDEDEFKEKEFTDNPEGPEPKQRGKKSSSPHSGSLPKAAKKPKVVVHSAGDVEISGDGYKWRKYGQKMVKGNPHPRNYYRCTSAGCPVRKHIESRVDSSTGLVITYKGVHDHEMPVPKKRHEPSSMLLSSPTPTSANNSQSTKAEALSNQVSPTQWSVNSKGELTGEESIKVKLEKPLESSRTLLSVGFEIKPC